MAFLENMNFTYKQSCTGVKLNKNWKKIHASLKHAIIELTPDDNIDTGKMKIIKEFARPHCARYRRVLRSLQAILGVLDFEEQ